MGSAAWLSAGASAHSACRWWWERAPSLARSPPFVVAPTWSRRPRRRGHPAGAKTADALANRDFIYLIVVLSLFGKAAWFILFVAIGTPIFVLVRLWADRPRRKS
jgi:hypothetical protein